MKESIVFYKSFYEAIKNIPQETGRFKKDIESV